MSQSLSSPYPWSRRWAPFEEVAGGFAALEQEDLLTLAQCADIRAVLLRGGSGSGKSTAMRQHAQRMRSENLAVLEVNLADGAQALASRNYSSGTTIFVDGLDFALLDPALELELMRCLDEVASARNVSIRLALRTGLVATKLTRRLHALFASDYAHLGITPLSSRDVTVAARTEKIDPVRFLEAVRLLRVTPLAAQPPTLKMLLVLWKRDGCLPTRRDEMYEAGCARLVDEVNDDLREARGGDRPEFVGHWDRSQRLAAASRVAAAMTFSGRDLIDLSNTPDEDNLAVSDVVGGTEPVQPRGQVAVDRPGIRELMRTGLFRAEGGERYAFVHPSHMRFLAAKFLRDRKIGPDRGMALLTLPNGRIGADRIEVASWIAALDPVYFEEIASLDPQVLLRAGIPASTADLRMKVAEALLREAAADTLDLEDEILESGDLVLASSSQLSKRLGQVLDDPTASSSLRDFAVQFAIDAVDVPVDACAAIAQNVHESISLRHSAVVALGWAGEAANEKLLAVAETDDASDPEQTLKTTALMLALRMGGLEPAGVVLRMAPRSARGPTLALGNMFARNGLRTAVLSRLTIDNLPAALEAAAVLVRRVDQGHGDWSEMRLMVSALGSRAFAHLSEALVRQALAAFIVTVSRDLYWESWSDTLHKRGMAAEATDELRASLLREIIMRAQSADLAEALLEIPYLLRGEDFDWVAREAAASPAGAGARMWATLAVQIAFGAGQIPFYALVEAGLEPNEINRVISATMALSKSFQRWTPPKQTAEETDVDPEQAQDEIDDVSLGETLISAAQDMRLLRLQDAGGGRSNAIAVAPATLLKLADDAARRLVKDSKDLLDVVLASIDRLERRLKKRDALVRALWNEEDNWNKSKAQKKRGASPKDENFLSDFLADHLRQDLEGRGILADREVQIRARHAETPGQRTDVFVQAFVNSEFGAAQRIASLTVEVKGCWNAELLTAMRTQLVERYLETTGEESAIYLVGWYVCPSWSDALVAAKRPQVGALDAVRGELQGQAATLSAMNGLYVSARILDATLS